MKREREKLIHSKENTKMSQSLIQCSSSERVKSVLIKKDQDPNKELYTVLHKLNKS